MCFSFELLWSGKFGYATLAKSTERIPEFAVEVTDDKGAFAHEMHYDLSHSNKLRSGQLQVPPNSLERF